MPKWRDCSPEKLSAQAQTKSAQAEPLSVVLPLLARSGAVMPGLSRLLRMHGLRKNSDCLANLEKYIPQGLKPALILRHLRHD